MAAVHRILVPLAHAPGASIVVDYACAIARGFDAGLVFLHVCEPPNAMVNIVPGVSLGDETIAECDAASALLDRAVATARRNGIAQVERILEPGGPISRVITGHAAAGDHDLIVMGTHGRTGIAHLLMGSVAEHVLRETRCPVLIVHLVTDTRRSRSRRGRRPAHRPATT